MGLSLGSFFRRAKPAAIPQRQVFSIPCHCGHVTRGLRRSSTQQVECPGCGQPLFVLSTSVYPAPRTKRPEWIDEDATGVTDLNSVSRTAADVATPGETDDRRQPSGGSRRSNRNVTPDSRPSKASPGKSAPETAAPRAGSSATTSRPSSGTSKSGRNAAPTAPEPHAAVTPRLIRRRGRLITPVRVVVGLAGITLIGWVVSLELTRRTRNAETAANTAAQRGDAALAAGNLILAEDEFLQAAAGLKKSTRNDREAIRIRQTATQLQACNHLLDVPLHQLVHESIDDLRKSGAAEIPATERYLDTWIILETWLQPEANTTVKIDLPIATVNGVATLQLDPSIWEPLGPITDRTAVLISGRVEAIARDPRHAGQFLVRLDTSSACLWTDGNLLAATGFPINDQTQSTIERQAARLGVAAK